MFAAVLGSDRFNDAYQLANTIPNIVYEFVMGGLLSAILIPLLVEAQAKHGKDSPEAWRVANLLLGYVGTFLAGVSVLAIVLAPEIVWLHTSMGRGVYAEQSRELATYFFRFFAAQMFFYGLNAVFMAILNSRGIFAITAAAPIVNNLVVIATLLLYRTRLVGVTGLAIGTTAGIAAMALVQVPWLVALKMPIAPRVTVRDPLLKSVAKLALPVVAVGIANFIATLARANLLYTVGSGFSTYTYCFSLIMMPYGIFAVSIATVLYPKLAQQVSEGDRTGYFATLALGTRWTVLVLLPISVALALLAEPIVRVLFERGQFSYANARLTAQFLAIYALSIVPYSLVVFASRAFYAKQDTLTPMWINLGGVFINIAAMFSLHRWLGILSVPAAAILTYCTTTAVSYFLLLRHHAEGAGEDLLSLWRPVAASACMAVGLWLGREVGQPRLIILERGDQFPGHISARFDAGGYLLLATQKDFATFWQVISRDDTPPPRFDFAKCRVLAVFAPRGSTSATLTLARATVLTADHTAELLVDVLRRSSMIPSAIEEPAFLAVLVRDPIRDAKVQFRILDRSHRPTVTSLMHLLQLTELWRLCLLVIFGSALFAFACHALGVPEAGAFAQRLWQRMRSRRTEP